MIFILLLSLKPPGEWDEASEDEGSPRERPVDPLGSFSALQRNADPLWGTMRPVPATEPPWAPAFQQ